MNNRPNFYFRKQYQNRHRKDFYRTNWQIRAQEVRLIGDDGNLIGVVSIDEARRLALEKKLDLVEIAPMAKPPVVKIIDFAKFKYEQKKKNKEEKKKSKGTGKIKEIRLRPFIGEADLKTRLERAKKEFAQENDLLRIVIRFKGRQITKQEFGRALLERIKRELAEFYQAENEPRLMGKQLILNLKPVKKK